MDVNKVIYLLLGLAIVILLAVVVNCFKRESEYFGYDICNCESEPFSNSTPSCVCPDIICTPCPVIECQE